MRTTTFEKPSPMPLKKRLASPRSFSVRRRVVAAANDFARERKRKREERDFNEADLRRLEEEPEEDRENEREHREDGVIGRRFYVLLEFGLVKAHLTRSRRLFVHIALPEIVRKPHDDDRRNRDRRMVVKDVVDDVFEPENACGNNVVPAQGRRHDRCCRSNDTRSRERRHLRRAQHRIERCHEDDGKRSGTRNDDREKRA